MFDEVGRLKLKSYCCEAGDDSSFDHHGSVFPFQGCLDGRFVECLPGTPPNVSGTYVAVFAGVDRNLHGSVALVRIDWLDLKTGSGWD